MLRTRLCCIWFATIDDDTFAVAHDHVIGSSARSAALPRSWGSRGSWAHIWRYVTRTNSVIRAPTLVRHFEGYKCYRIYEKNKRSGLHLKAPWYLIQWGIRNIAQWTNWKASFLCLAWLPIYLQQKYGVWHVWPSRSPHRHLSGILAYLHQRSSCFDEKKRGVFLYS